MADKPDSDAGEGTIRIRLSAALEAEASARHDLATALAHERSLFRTMIDLIPAFIYAKDTDSRFIACNAHLAESMGTRPESAIGKTDLVFYTRELADKFMADEQALIKSGTAIIGLEEPGFDKVTGTPRTVVTSKVPLRNDGGESLASSASASTSPSANSRNSVSPPANGWSPSDGWPPAWRTKSTRLCSF